MEQLDVVELLAETAGVEADHAWPAGTEGVVLELWKDSALVEISSDDGETLDMIDVPLDQAKVIWVAKDHPSPAAIDDISVRAADTRARRG